jgi:hypothetical protein
MAPEKAYKLAFLYKELNAQRTEESDSDPEALGD